MKIIITDGGRSAAGLKRTGKDCVVRAITIATEMPYVDVHKAINHLADNEFFDGSDSDEGVGRKLWRNYISSLGWKWTSTMGFGTGCKVHLKDGELPNGRLIVRVSKHLCAVIDGVIYDTQDCSRNGTRCVYGYFKKL